MAEVVIAVTAVASLLVLLVVNRAAIKDYLNEETKRLFPETRLERWLVRLVWFSAGVSAGALVLGIVRIVSGGGD